MTVTGDQHRLMVDYMLACLETGERDNTAFIQKLAEIAPQGKWSDMERAQADAEGIWLEQIEVEQAEADAIRRLMPLFDGMPEGMELLECAIVKARRGDSLAIEYCRHEGVEL